MREFIEHDRTHISRPEQERMLVRVEQNLAEGLTNTFDFKDIPPHLKTTDRILQRWAAEGTGEAAENPDVYQECRPPPLDPTTFAIVEGCVSTAPARLRSYTRARYRTQVPAESLAKNRRMSVRNLGRLWLDALNHLRAEFLDTEHADLVALVKMQA